MKGMTGEIVFVMLVVGIVCIAFICKSKIREKESKLEETERKRRLEEVVQKEEKKEKTEDSELQRLKKKFLETEQKLWELKSKEGYEALFHKVVMPLQVLLGFAEVPFHTLTEDRMDYYLREVIADPLIRAVEQANAKIVNGKLFLSVSKKEFDSERIKKESVYLQKSELESYIQENERKLELGNVVSQKVKVVQGLGSIVEELKELEKSTLEDQRKIYELAQRVQLLFEKNSIYPMFASDQRLSSYPELKRRYIPVNENSIRYPGLFIEQNGVLDVFGANIGMDDCGV